MKQRYAIMTPRGFLMCGSEAKVFNLIDQVVGLMNSGDSIVTLPKESRFQLGNEFGASPERMRIVQAIGVEKRKQQRQEET